MRLVYLIFIRICHHYMYKLVSLGVKLFLCIVFSSTYPCEQLFSLMKINKSPVRFRLTDTRLNLVIKVTQSHKISP